MYRYIEMKNICKGYGSIKAVDDVCLSINKGEIYCLLGANGAGKSTLIKLLIGILDLKNNDSGKIVFDGCDTNKRPSIGYVSESRAIIEDLTADEFLDFVAALNKVEINNASKIKNYFLELFDLENRRDELIKTYSNGMKKKVQLISALIHSPEVLIVDEPFAALDPESIYIMKKMFRKVAQKGCTIIMCTHELNVADDLGDRFLILKNGKKLFEGTKDELEGMCSCTTIENGYMSLVKGCEEVKRIESGLGNIPYEVQSAEK